MIDMIGMKDHYTELTVLTFSCRSMFRLLPHEIPCLLSCIVDIYQDTSHTSASTLIRLLHLHAIEICAVQGPSISSAKIRLLCMTSFKLTASWRVWYALELHHVRSYYSAALWDFRNADWIAVDAIILRYVPSVGPVTVVTTLRCTLEHD